MIEVHNLSKTFKTHKKEPGLKGSIKALFSREEIVKKAVHNASLKISEGEIVGLIGANGAGKTTLVKMLAGIIHPTSGTANVLGHTPWGRHNDFRRNISLIMGQKASLWWDLPAWDCFILLREIYQIPVKEFEKRVLFLAETIGLNEQLKVQIRRLSLGERMKAELIAALLHNPKVVYLDEPTIGLDLTAQRAIRGFIKNYQQEHSPAMILTSHYMEDIEKLCKRIIVIKDGEIIYDGDLDKINKTIKTKKIIHVHLKKENALKFDDLPCPLGQICEKNDDTIKLQVERSQVKEAALWVLENYPVHDLNIEEEDISDTIEKIIRSGLSK